MEKIEKIKEFVEELSKGESTGHDYFHAIRVWKNAKEIAKDYEVDMEIVEVSALVHDLIDEKFENFIEKGELKQKLIEFGFKEKVDEIMDIIDSISFRKNVDKDKLSLEAKIVQDADRLDALGAIGIARVFAYSGKTRRPIHNPQIKPELNKIGNKSKTAINHFYEKLFLLKEMMNTKKAREIAEKREEFMLKFLEQFFEEWEGRR